MENTDCIFCKIIKGEIPSTKVYEDDKVLAFLDIAPVNIGHTLVIPREHYRNMLETPDEIMLDVIKVGKRIGNALRKNGVPGITASLNNEADGGQTVFHTHLHIMPRSKDDGHKLWDTKQYQEGEKEEMAKKISAAL